MPDKRAVDSDKLKDYAKLVFGALGGAMTSTLIGLGDRLGLFEKLAEIGPATSVELAAASELDERWIREWLYQQGAAGILDYHATPCTIVLISVCRIGVGLP